MEEGEIPPTVHRPGLTEHHQMCAGPPGAKPAEKALHLSCPLSSPYPCDPGDLWAALAQLHCTAPLTPSHRRASHPVLGTRCWGHHATAILTSMCRSTEQHRKLLQECELRCSEASHPAAVPGSSVSQASTACGTARQRATRCGPGQELGTVHPQPWHRAQPSCPHHGRATATHGTWFPHPVLLHTQTTAPCPHPSPPLLT